MKKKKKNAQKAKHYSSRIIKEKFIKLVKEFNVHKNTMIFEINIAKLINIQNC